MTRKDSRNAPPPGALWPWLVGSLVLVSVASALGGAATAESAGTWYPTLVKPRGTPPGSIFPAVWPVLYTLMGVAAFLVLRAAGGFSAARVPLIAYGAQLALNVLWPVLFFGLRQPFAAALEMIPLLAAILATMALFWPWSRTAALLLLPYLAWTGFAAWLSWGIALAN